jgi:hypothetical protein
LCIYAIGVPKGVTLLEFEGAHQKQEQEQPEEPEVLVGEGFPKKSCPSALIIVPYSF